MEYSDVRYLLAKAPIDDRSLNQHVLAELKRALQAEQTGPRVLELGAGVGTMFSRLLDWGVLERGHYTLLDRDEDSLEAARRRLGASAAKPSSHDEELAVHKGNAELSCAFVAGDAVPYLAQRQRQAAFDAVFANAVLDLLDLRPALQSIWGVLRPRGLFWFTINFDGDTILLPEHPLDDAVLQLYHQSMDTRVIDGRPSGDSKTGRHLLEAIPETGARILAAGSSDWVVIPEDGAYPGDEQYFLHHIVNTVWQALRGDARLDTEEFDAWTLLRHTQIERAELSYVAHQLDVVGRAPDRS